MPTADEKLIIINSVLEDNEMIDKLNYLEPKHLGSYSKIYGKILEKYNKNKAITKIELIIDGIDVPETETVPFAVIDKYAHKIFDDYQLSIVKKCFKKMKFTDLDKTLSQLEQIYEQIDSNYLMSASDKPVDIKEFVEEMKGLRKSEAPLGIMVDSLPTFNSITGGMLPSDMIGIYGKEKSSKTTFAHQIVLDVAVSQKIPTAIFNFEMDEIQILMKTMSMMTGISQNVLRNPQQNKYDDIIFEVKAQTFADGFKDAKLFIFDEMFNEIQIYSKVKMLIKKFGVKLIVIDYLMLMESYKSFGIRRDELNYLSRFFKRMAKQLNIIIILISQANDSGQREAEAKGLSRDANYYFYVERLDEHTKVTIGDSEYTSIEGDFVIVNRGIRHGISNRAFITRFIDNMYREIDIKEVYYDPLG